MPIDFSNPLSVFTLVLRIAAIGVLIVSVETLVRVEVFRNDGLMSWEVGCLQRPIMVRGAFGWALDRLLRYPNVNALLAVRAALAAAIIMGPANWVRSPWLVCPTAVVILLLTIRHPYGQDGADQMTVIIFIGAGLTLLGREPWVIKVYLWFLALQVCLSYGTAGVAKATAAGWLDGSFLVGIAASQLYGHPRAGQALSVRPVLSRAISRSIVVWETAFPLVLITPRPLAYVIVATGVLFHLSNGVLMGLNNFLWLFVATYPALLYCLISRGW
ncbi:MAG TPA: hypothetical protein VGD59_06745 [Acidisarcina sp.]